MYAFGMPRNTAVDAVERAARVRSAASYAPTPTTASPTGGGVDRSRQPPPRQPRSTPMLDNLRRRAHDLISGNANTDDLLAHMFADVGGRAAAGKRKSKLRHSGRAMKDYLDRATEDPTDLRRLQMVASGSRTSQKAIVSTTDDSFGYGYLTPKVTSKRSTYASSSVADTSAQSEAGSSEADALLLPLPNQPDPVTGELPMPGPPGPPPANRTGNNNEWIHFRSAYYDIHRILLRTVSAGAAPPATLDADPIWRGFRMLFVAIDSMFTSTDFEFRINSIKSRDTVPQLYGDFKSQTSSLNHLMTLHEMRHAAAHPDEKYNTFYRACRTFVLHVIGLKQRVDPSSQLGSDDNPRPKNFSAFVYSHEYAQSEAGRMALTVDQFISRQTDAGGKVIATVHEEVVAGAQLFFYYQQLFFTRSRNSASNVPWLQTTVGKSNSISLVPALSPQSAMRLNTYVNRQGLASKVFHYIRLYPTPSYVLLLPNVLVQGRGDDRGIQLRDVPAEDRSFPERTGYARKQYTFKVGLPLTQKVDRSFERSNIVIFLGDYFLGYFVYDHFTNRSGLLDEHNALVDNSDIDPYYSPLAANLVKLGGYTHVKNDPI